jgi:hypothetical protein
MTEPITLHEYDMKRERLWGLPAIAEFLDVSVDTARRWARRPGVPIFKSGGRHCAIRSELWRWNRSKPTTC